MTPAIEFPLRAAVRVGPEPTLPVEIGVGQPPVELRPCARGDRLAVEMPRGVEQREGGIERDQRVELVDRSAGLLFEMDVRPGTVADVVERLADDPVLNPGPLAGQVVDLLAGDRRRDRDELLVAFGRPPEDGLDPLAEFGAEFGRRRTGRRLDLDHRLDELPFGPRRRLDEPIGGRQIPLAVDDPVFDFDAPSYR